MPHRFSICLAAVCWASACAAIACSSRCQAASPASELIAAVRDIERVPTEHQATTRYLSLYAVDPAVREQTAAVVGYVLNALSRSRTIVRPEQITSTLLRIDLTHYTNAAAELKQWIETWEQIAAVDAYWHLRTEVLANNGNHSLSAKTKVVTVDGGWVDLTAAERLRTATRSIGALLRADHFVIAATVPPHYYTLAGIAATEAEFVRSLGVDVAAIDRLRANAGANLLISGITNKPRRVVWQQGPLGGVYATLDVERVAAERDPIRRPVKDNGVEFQYDASEWFAMQANGMWSTALYDRQGRRQDSVPDRIAKDTSDPHGDGIVVAMLSCIRCHREGGLRPFMDDQSQLWRDGVELRSTDLRVVRRAVEFYDEPRLQRQMQFDRETYTHAVHRATAGMRPEDLADALARTVRDYSYLPVTPEVAARELGIDPDELRVMLAPSRDPMLLRLRHGRAVLRGQWESSFAEAALLARALSIEH